MYSIDIIKDKPHKIKETPKLENILNILQVSDVHTDAEYLEGTEVDCKDPLCCRVLPKPSDLNSR